MDAKSQEIPEPRILCISTDGDPCFIRPSLQRPLNVQRSIAEAPEEEPAIRTPTSQKCRISPLPLLDLAPVMVGRSERLVNRESREHVIRILRRRIGQRGPIRGGDASNSMRQYRALP